MKAATWSDEAEVVAAPLTVGDATFLADPSGALFHEGERALLVADLHFEKGSSFARRGMMLPPYDTIDTLAILTRVIGRYRPRIVIALGDSFHDPFAAERLSNAARDGLAALQGGRDWLWLTGNHDPLAPQGLAGDVRAEHRFGLVTLRHEPRGGEAANEIAGHLHPVARVLASGGVARRRCFVSDGLRCVMPAFGVYAGGLNVLSRPFQHLWTGRPIVVHALGRDRVYPVPIERCIANG